MHDLKQLFHETCIVPVLVIEELKHAEPLANILLESGLCVLEITLRTQVSMDAIQTICEQFPEATIGAGTILTANQFEDAQNRGAKFFVSPGTSSTLLEIAKNRNLAYLPGAQTISEILHLKESGMDCIKFFPARLSGGVEFMGAINSVLPDISFCPTGGITQETAGKYLSLPNVFCVGGSWIAPKNLLSTENWDEISRRARLAAKFTDTHQ